MFGNVDTSNDARVRELRKCGKCGAGTMAVVHVTQHYNRGLPMGRSYQHRCGSCQATLESLSAWRAITELAFGAMLTVFGFGMTAWTLALMWDSGVMAAFSSGGVIARSLFSVVMFLGGLWWTGHTTWKVLHLMLNHPVVGAR